MKQLPLPLCSLYAARVEDSPLVWVQLRHGHYLNIFAAHVLDFAVRFPGAVLAR